ncbi:hypothetical protein [Bythopirellula goksoeyrii]|uniref:Protein kinase domain-containing protein n=1 Tax=Bythopirellula goksoeyrii TaxID=1400387 RepID=A0A5B9QF00_9BACT|nr:hypothetical protein [Bythopirellula goksoeyrii]QEG36220.1 hypothetical protein Pr1d_35320 [Bythopirellula goksoeyrii]
MIRKVRLEKSGYSINLGPPVTNAAGGMGRNFLHETNGGMFLKEMFDEFPEAKIRYLLQNTIVPSRDSHNYAWPLDIGIDEATGEPKFYLMKKVDNSVDLGDVMTAADWLNPDFKTRVALNEVRGLIDLERAGYFPGDMPNAMVDPEGKTTEIDIDSWQITRPGVEFLCGVGKPDWLAPELLAPWREQRLDEIATTSLHISWSLAVSLWMILRGDHPFECRFVGAGIKPGRQDRIEQGYWAFSSQHSDFKPRRGTQPLNTLDPELSFLFRKTFEVGHSKHDERPKLADWENALSRLDSGGDVTLSDLEWECVKTGSIPSHPIKRPARKGAQKPNRKRKVVAVAAVSALGVAAYAAGSYGLSSNLLSMLPFPSSVNQYSHEAVTNPREMSTQRDALPSQKLTQSDALLIKSNSRAVPAPPAISLHKLKKSKPGEIPSLWQAIQKESEK